MPSLSISKLATCFSNGSHEFGTRFHNLSDSSMELQIRLGSTMKRVHTLKPGSSKMIKRKMLFKACKPSDVGEGGLLYDEDGACNPYVLIHEKRGGFSRMVKQQYVSIEDLRDCSEIRVYRDHQRGCICVRKKARQTD